MKKKSALGACTCAIYLFLLLITPFSLLAQNERQVSGVIKSGNTVMAGVSVTLKENPKIGDISDAKGHYSIRVPENGNLLFSFVGYKPLEIAVNGRSEINALLVKENTSLDEVVVVGYGTQRKATLTGAVSVVKGDELLKSPSTDISNSLVGRTPGVIATNNSGQPGSDGSNIYIRGISTFSGATQPLIVIDGVANRPGGFGNIDPNDVESISVLKDASAAIYGAQAANGVILVTTKKGRTGKPMLTFNYNQGFNTWAKTEKLTNAYQYAQMVNDISVFGGGTPVYAQNDLTLFQNGSDPIGHPNTDWIKMATKNVALQDRASLTLSGGTENFKYYSSLGMSNQDGQFNSGTFKYKQYNFDLNMEGQVTKSLKLGFGSMLRWQDQTSSPVGTNTTFSSLIGALPTSLAKNPNGTFALGGQTGSTGAQLNALVNATDLAGINDQKRVYSLNTFKGRFDIPGVRGLYLDGFLSVDFGFVDSSNWNKSYTVYAYDPVAKTYTPAVLNGTLGLASLDQQNTNSLTISENLKLNYERSFGKHSIKAFVSYEQSTYDFRWAMAHREQFISQAIPQLSFGSSTNINNNGNEYKSARQNYFGRINYSYNNMYFLEAQLRYDGSDVFAPNNRWGLFPSLSAGWKISDYEWFKNSLPAISFLKLRGAWGKLGNDNIPPFQYAQFYNVTQYGRIFYNGAISGYSTLSPGVSPNPNATWESQTATNLAVDGSLLDNKLSFTFEVFHQRRDNILAPPNASIPLYTGIVLPDENIGIVDNKGWEAQLSYKGQANKLGYFISGNITYAKNKVVYMDEILGGRPAYQALTGHPVGSYLLYNAIGIYQSSSDISSSPTNNLTGVVPGDLKFKDVNKDGVIDQNDQTVKDLTSIPQIVYGANIALNYMNFDLSILFQGQAKAARYFRAVSGKSQNFTIEDYEGRSTPGNITDKPRASNVYGSPQGFGNTYYLSSTAFLRLKNVELAYSIKSNELAKSGISHIRVYINTFNLFTITPYKGLDPESVDGQGLNYPINRTFNAGVSVSF
ncbi:MAG: TonB-dependent receptor [Bacteroidetes bacterium]|nr:TonB-dependent receptor [Bacteroidota bacterium]